MKTETIILEVKVRVSYPDGRRKEAIGKAKGCVTQCRVLGAVSADPKSAKIKPKPKKEIVYVSSPNTYTA